MVAVNHTFGLEMVAKDQRFARHLIRVCQYFAISLKIQFGQIPNEV